MSIFNDVKNNFGDMDISSKYNDSKEYLKLQGRETYDFTKDAATNYMQNTYENGKDIVSSLLFGSGTQMDVSAEDDLRKYLATSLQDDGVLSKDSPEDFDLKGLMGAPFKFSRTDDPPIANGSEYGRSYLEQFIEFGNIVAFTPGISYFLPGIGAETRERWVTNTTNSEGKSQEEMQLENEGFVAEMKKAGTKKLYAFRPASNMYWDYVNMIWRFLVKLSGLDDHSSRMVSYFRSNVLGTESEDGSLIDSILGDDTKLSTIRWGKVNGSGSLNKLLYGFVGNDGMSRIERTYSFVPFYNDGPFQVSESFDNTSGESRIGSFLNNTPADDLSRELGFLSGMTYRDTNDYDMSKKDQESKEPSKLTTLLSVKSFGVKTIIPEVWKDSGSGGRDHTFRFKFACCDGTPESYLFHTLRPLCHLLALSLPIHHRENYAFAAPLLVRVFARGLPTIDVGMVTSLQIERDPRSVTNYGLMTDMTVTITVKDLTPVVALPNNRLGLDAESAVGFMSMIGGLTGCNTQLLNWEKMAIVMKAQSIFEFFSFNSIKHHIGNATSDLIGALKVRFTKGGM